MILFDGMVIGCVELWVDDFDIFDGWVEIEGCIDELIVNGVNWSWVVVEVVCKYMEYVVIEM